MKVYIVILLLGLLPLCTALNCYVCTSINSACNDPFNATGTGIITSDMSAFAYCTKTKAGGIVSRAGASICIAFSTDANTYSACCQSNLCNGAQGQYPASFLLGVSIFIILMIFKWF